MGWALCRPPDGGGRVYRDDAEGTAHLVSQAAGDGVGAGVRGVQRARHFARRDLNRCILS